MYNIKTGMRLLKHNIFGNILMIFTMAFSMLVLCFFANYTNSLFDSKRMVESFNKDTTYYYAINYNANDFDVAKLKSVKDNCFMANSTFIAGGKQLNFIGYGGLLASLAKINVEKGKWFSDVEKEKDVYNVVIAKNDKYYVGDVFTITNLQKTLKVKVTGILPDTFNYIYYKGFEYPTSADILSTKYVKDKDNDALFVIGDFDAIADNKLLYNMFIFEDDISFDDLKSNIEYLKVYGEGSLLKDMIEVTNNQIKESIELLIPTVSLALILNIVGLFLVSSITVAKNKKDFSILFYCGATKVDIAVVTASYIFSLFALSVGLFAIINALLKNQLLKGMIIYTKYFWISVVVALIIVLPVALITSSKTNKNIGQTIKEE